MTDIVAKGFPRDLDGHPLLAWMGLDWVEFVALRLLDEFRRQDEQSELAWISCEGSPALQSHVRDGTVTEVELRVPLELLLQDATRTAWRIRGTATFTGKGLAEPDSPSHAVAFEIESTERSGTATARQFSCAVCGKEAGHLEVDNSSGEPEVRRTTFTSTLTQKLTAGGAERLAAALEAGEAGAVFGVDPEFAPFYCPSCDASYCGEHMRHWDVFDDDGLHDSIRGCCPAGHERMLED